MNSAPVRTMADRLSMHDVMSRIMHDSDSGSDFEVSDTVS